MLYSILYAIYYTIYNTTIYHMLYSILYAIYYTIYNTTIYHMLYSILYYLQYYYISYAIFYTICHILYYLQYYYIPYAIFYTICHILYYLQYYYISYAILYTILLRRENNVLNPVFSPIMASDLNCVTALLTLQCYCCEKGDYWSQCIHMEHTVNTPSLSLEACGCPEASTPAAIFKKCDAKNSPREGEGILPLVSPFGVPQPH